MVEVPVTRRGPGGRLVSSDRPAPLPSPQDALSLPGVSSKAPSTASHEAFAAEAAMTAQQDAAGGSTPSEVSAPPEPSAAATSAAEEGASLGVRPAVEPAKKRPRLGEDPSGPSTATSAEDAESAAAVAAGPTAEEEAMAAAASLMMHSCGQSEPPTSRSGSGGAAAAGSPAPRLDPAMEAAAPRDRDHKRSLSPPLNTHGSSTPTFWLPHR